MRRQPWCSQDVSCVLSAVSFEQSQFCALPSQRNSSRKVLVVDPVSCCVDLVLLRGSVNIDSERSTLGARDPQQRL